MYVIPDAGAGTVVISSALPILDILISEDPRYLSISFCSESTSTSTATGLALTGRYSYSVVVWGKRFTDHETRTFPEFLESEAVEMEWTKKKYNDNYTYCECRWCWFVG